MVGMLVLMVLLLCVLELVLVVVILLKKTLKFLSLGKHFAGYGTKFYSRLPTTLQRLSSNYSYMNGYFQNLIIR